MLGPGTGWPQNGPQSRVPPPTGRSWMGNSRALEIAGYSSPAPCHTPCHAPCTVHHAACHAPCTIHHTPYTTHHTPCTMHHAIHHALYTIHHAPCTMQHAMHHALYTIHHAPCHTPCTIHHTPYTMQHAMHHDPDHCRKSTGRTIRNCLVNDCLPNQPNPGHSQSADWMFPVEGLNCRDYCAVCVCASNACSFKLGAVLDPVLVQR